MMPKPRRLKLDKKELALFAAPLFVMGCIFGASKAKPFVQNRFAQSRKPPPMPPKRGVTSIAFSPDGQKLATGNENGSVKVWNARSGTLLQTLRRKGLWVSAVAFSSNGKVLAGTSSKSLFLWSQPSGQLLRVLTPVQGDVSSVAFSPDNQLVAAGSGTRGLYQGTGAINVWNVKTGTPTAVLKGNVAYVGAVAFSPNGKSIAASCGVNRAVAATPTSMDVVRLWALKTKTIQWETPNGFVEGNVAFSSQGERLAHGGSTPSLLNVESGQPTVFKSSPWEGSAWHVAFSPDGQVLASGGVGSPIVFWDASTGKWIDSGNGLDHYFATALVFSPDGKRLVSSDGEGLVKIWDVSQINGRRKLANPQLTSHLKLLMTLDTVKAQVVTVKTTR